MGTSAEMLLLYLSGGVFLLFVIIMGLGGHVMPTGNMVRSPTRNGDIAIAIFSLAMIVGLIWFSWGGWKKAVGVEQPVEPAPVLFAPLAQQGGISHIGLLYPDSTQHPMLAKKQLREYCKGYMGQRQGNSQCLVMLWIDPRIAPRQFPIPANRLSLMAANYVYKSVGAVDRFCWLTNGQMNEADCF